MVHPFEIKFIVTALGAEAGSFIQTDCSGLNTADEEKHPIVSFTNITLFDRCAKFYFF